nr:CGNR zinc finger domain-containing protein [Rhodococcus sp. (in: high G+C Gram-positive bacteria)]
MSQTPTERFRLEPAPDGLARVQDLLNTRAIEAYELADLLADGNVASATLGRELSDSDARRLRGLRSTLEDVIGGRPVEPTETPSTLTVDETGVVRLEASGSEWQGVASKIWAEVLLAQRTDTWRRLKRCKNEQCGSAFYDRSRNNSGVWHDVKTCGNQANLRASRARRKSESPTAPA